MAEISLKALLNTIRESNENGRKYCFILGSGVSRSSGIPTGVDLCERWVKQLNDIYTEAEIKNLPPTTETAILIWKESWKTPDPATDFIRLQDSWRQPATIW